MFWQSNRVEYVELGFEKEDGDESPSNSRRVGDRIRKFLGIIGAIVLIGASFVAGSYFGDFYREEGYNTEFYPATSAIKTHKITFDNPLRWNGTNVYMEKDPTRPNYVGKPSKAIDEAWDKLLDRRWFAMKPQESSHWDDQMTPLIHGKIYTGLDMFHSLHCLDALRRTLDRDYYKELSTYDDKIHLYHCVDHIRQAIQCGSDLTPLDLVMYRVSDSRGLILGNPTVHTCRKADNFRQWLDERDDIL